MLEEEEKDDEQDLEDIQTTSNELLKSEKGAIEPNDPLMLMIC